MPPAAVQRRRAKRTHARRSCDVCKLRKTRCELPDLTVPSSAEPLPEDKSCHRCRILGIHCVVDDSSKKNKAGEAVKAEDGEGTRTLGKRKKKATKTQRGPPSSPAPEPSAPGTIDHTLDVLHEFRPGSNASSWPAHLNTPPYGSREAAESFRTNSIKLHGRPLELLCAMLRVAYGRKAIPRTGRLQDEVPDLDLDTIIDPDLRDTMDAGVSRLRVLHPYVESLSALYHTYQSDPSASVCLLVSTVIYFASLAAPQTSVYQELRQLRHKLTPYLLLMRDSVLLSLPQSFHAIQALDILATHAPLGVLPTQLVNPQILALARGQVCAATTIATKLKYLALVRQTRGVVKFHGIGVLEADHALDLWLWLSLCASEARVSLEDETVVKPANLDEAANVVQELFGSDYQEVWGSAMHKVDANELVGRLSVCDRVLRLSDVIDSMVRLRATLDTASTDYSFDLVSCVNDEVEYLARRLDNLDTKHETIMAMLIPATQGVEASWTAYRALRKRFEINKVFSVGLRSLMGVVYIPGHPLAMPNLPANMQPFAKVSYALSRIVHPPDVIPVLYNGSNPASLAAHTLGKRRAEMCRSTLAAFKDNRTTISTSTPMRALIPYHDAFSVIIESTKVLVEVHAGFSVVNYPYNGEAVALPDWMPLLVQNSEILRQFAYIGSPWGDSNFESVAKGCANLTASMIRLMHEWAEVGGHGNAPGGAPSGAPSGVVPAPEQGQAPWSGSGPGQTQTQGAPGVQPGPGATVIKQEGYQGSSANQSNPASASGGECDPHGLVPHPPNPYMDTSDRWMASDHGQGHPPPLAHHHQQPPPPPPAHEHHVQHPHLHQQHHQHQSTSEQYVTAVPPQPQPQPHPQPEPHHYSTNIVFHDPLDALLSHAFNHQYGVIMPVQNGSPHPQIEVERSRGPGSGHGDQYHAQVSDPPLHQHQHQHQQLEPPPQHQHPHHRHQHQHQHPQHDQQQHMPWPSHPQPPVDLLPHLVPY